MPEQVNLGMLLERLIDYDEEFDVSSFLVRNSDGEILTDVDIIGGSLVLEFSESSS